MTTVVQPLLEKGIVDYSIIHTALVEYFTIADRVMLTMFNPLPLDPVCVLSMTTGVLGVVWLDFV